MIIYDFGLFSCLGKVFLLTKGTLAVAILEVVFLMEPTWYGNESQGLQ